MPTPFMPSMQPKAWSSGRGLPTCHGNSREFVVKDCDDRLLAFGVNYKSVPSSGPQTERTNELPSYGKAILQLPGLAALVPRDLDHPVRNS